MISRITLPYRQDTRTPTTQPCADVDIKAAAEQLQVEAGLAQQLRAAWPGLWLEPSAFNDEGPLPSEPGLGQPTGLAHDQLSAIARQLRSLVKSMHYFVDRIFEVCTGMTLA